jgi:anti-anti-sigma factor
VGETPARAAADTAVLPIFLRDATRKTRYCQDPDMRLKISTRKIENTIIVDCYGHLVFGDETILLREQVKGLLPGHHQIVLNLRDLTFMDSSGMGALIELFTSTQRAGGTLKLANISKHIRDALTITKLILVFETFPDEHAAVASFQKQPA